MYDICLGPTEQAPGMSWNPGGLYRPCSIMQTPIHLTMIMNSHIHGIKLDLQNLE